MEAAPLGPSGDCDAPVGRSRVFWEGKRTAWNFPSGGGGRPARKAAFLSSLYFFSIFRRPRRWSALIALANSVDDERIA